VNGPTNPARLWVVGRRGLLGGAVRRAAEREGRSVTAVAVPWDDPAAARATLAGTARAFVDAPGPWAIAWCAGRGTVATDPAAIAAEATTFATFADDLAAAVQGTPAAGRGALFVASSAGGVYAGSASPPYSESSPVAAVSAYGSMKLQLERIVGELTERTGIPSLVARIANLYGPGQDLSKPQGLVSQLCRAMITRQPVSIYVPLDTIRDYLYVDDCARMVLRGLDRLPGSGSVLKIMASHQPTTLGALIGELTRIGKRRPPVVLGASPYADLQPPDLRLRSEVWPELDALATTPLPAGLKATIDDVGRHLRIADVG
jgi:UDP-glucose 4-epimerase